MKSSTLELRVANLDCEHDAASIERALNGFPGITGLKVYPKAAKVALTYDPTATSPDVLSDKLDKLGFPAQAAGVMPEQPKPWRNPKVVTSALSGILLLVGLLLGMAGVAEGVTFFVYVAAILIGGYFFGREALEELILEREIGIELLMSIAAIVATLMGQAAEGAMLVFLYSLSEAAEGYTEQKTRSAVRALMDLAPRMAHVRRNGHEFEIPVEELVVGDVFIVKPGQAIPTDGVVQIGLSNVNQAPVTGESVPVEKKPGDTVFAGTLNEEGALEVQATKTFADNTIARIIHMVEEAQEKKGTSQRFIERFGRRYSPAVLLAGILIAIIPPLLFGGTWEMWLERAVVFIVAAAPCALVISIPITVVATLGTGARNGVLIKGGIFVEALAKVKVVALDKTGTLTRGKPEVTDLVAFVNEDEGMAVAHDMLLETAAGIERLSQHPLARAIVRYADAQGFKPAPVVNFKSLTGAGACAQLDGKMVYVCSPDYYHSVLGVTLHNCWDDINHLQDEGKTVVVIGDDTTAWGALAIRDTIRPNARKALADLHEAGIERVVMLTGDNKRTAQAIASEVGIDDFYSDLKPEDKVNSVRELAREYGHVAMVGDGVNDAPALAEATVGVAMGAAGTDVALETADVALMADNLEKLAYAVTLAHRNQKVVRQNLALSIVVISALVVGAVLGVFTLPMAVLAHEISEFVVIGSGLRMLRS